MNLHVDVERVCLAKKAVRAELLAERTPDGRWIGQLASSPPATAAAISALVVAHRRDTGEALRENLSGDGQVMDQLVQCDLSELLLESVHWLARNQNPDGGWGDCDRGGSNIAATMLVQAAFRLTGIPAKYADLMARADQYVDAQGGAASLWRRHGDDRTYVATILSTCALAGMVPWRQVPVLRYELVCIPKAWQQQLQPPVARYALPPFLGVGRAKFHHDPPRNPFTRLLRRSFHAKSVALLERSQAADGGFVDSTPYTAFVVMSLASIGYREHPIVERGLEFLLSSVRADASWPVRNSMATRNTCLAVNSLAAGLAGLASPAQIAARRGLQSISRHTPPHQSTSWDDTAHVGGIAADTAAVELARSISAETAEEIADDDLVLDERCLNWLLDSQHTGYSPITDVPPGGWGWSDAPGALANANDTASALVALVHWQRRFAQLHRERIEHAAKRGISWLLELQNEDGGWSTFYRDGSPSPLDESGSDVTANALRALYAWKGQWTSSARNAAAQAGLPELDSLIAQAIERGLKYLMLQQQADGSFIPLWSGNEHHPHQHNTVIGTAQVLIMCSDLGLLETDMSRHAARWLVTAQHASGGWGFPRAPLDYSGSDKDGFRAWRANESMAKLCSVEETARGVSALLPLADTDPTCSRAVSNGLAWLAAAVEQDAHRQGAVIGFYFSKIWYHERLYPLIFASGALSQASRQLEPQRHAVSPVS